MHYSNGVIVLLYQSCISTWEISEYGSINRVVQAIKRYCYDGTFSLAARRQCLVCFLGVRGYAYLSVFAIRCLLCCSFWCFSFLLKDIFSWIHRTKAPLSASVCSTIVDFSTETAQKCYLFWHVYETCMPIQMSALTASVAPKSFW